MKIFRFSFYLSLIFIMTGCATFKGDWYNNNFAPEKELWSLNNSKNFDEKWGDCGKLSTEKKNLTSSMIETLLKSGIKNPDIGINQNKFEQCLLDNGFKFHPTGFNNNYANYCTGDSKAMPSCRSAGY